MSEPPVSVIREQAYPVRLERVERILYLLQSTFCVGQRKRGEAAKAPRIIRPQFCRCLVTAAHSFSDFVVRRDAETGGSDGEDCSGRTTPIHVFEVRSKFPISNNVQATCLRESEVDGRRKVMVNIDTARVRGCLCCGRFPAQD